MGAWIRRYEKTIEREILHGKGRGVPTAERIGAITSPESQSERAGEDPRRSIPPLGLREYWYPALPAKKVTRKPIYWNMLGDDLVFFRDKQGEVAALSDICPHRSASLSEGACFYRGFVSCPYHGATFDGHGECVAFIPEGPDSKMVGNLKARVYPTSTLGGWVFIWMGEGKPAPLEEDVPPEFFETDRVVLSSYTYWPLNWLLAIENHSDSHNASYLHRNSINQLTGLSPGRTRTPVSAQGRIVNGRGLITTHAGANYYAKDGKVPYQMYYPGVDGVWPLHRWRLLWQWFFKWLTSKSRARSPFAKNEEWRQGHHFPSVVRTGGGSTRYAVAVEPNRSRIIYFYFPHAGNAISRLWRKLHFVFIRNPLEYNFSSQDGRGAASCRFWTPEHLAPTDSQLTIFRKMILELSRDAGRKKAQLDNEEAILEGEGKGLRGAG
ncbi:MAG: Rieske 2Fe-2S domain-containing protein [Deltaproteobacteria bacterium]|nr:Rieske 2Fe-2S domain-containing protein [Deltaproteobacteria bacterium]